MPIRDADLNRDFRIFDQRCTIQEAIDQAGTEAEFYLVCISMCPSGR